MFDKFEWVTFNTFLCVINVKLYLGKIILNFEFHDFSSQDDFKNYGHLYATS